MAEHRTSQSLRVLPEDAQRVSICDDDLWHLAAEPSEDEVCGKKGVTCFATGDGGYVISYEGGGSTVVNPDGSSYPAEEVVVVGEPPDSEPVLNEPPSPPDAVPGEDGPTAEGGAASSAAQVPSISAPPIEVGTSSTPRLRETQCDRLREVLEYERQHGTFATARRYTNTFHEPSDFAGPGLDSLVALGPEFNNAPIPTIVGVIDLDWYTDLLWAHTAPGLLPATSSSSPSFATNPAYATVAYIGGKVLWNIIRDKWVWPFEDDKERVAIEAFWRGYTTYASLFPDEIWAHICPSTPKPSESRIEF